MQRWVVIVSVLMPTERQIKNHIIGVSCNLTDPKIRCDPDTFTLFLIGGKKQKKM